MHTHIHFVAKLQLGGIPKHQDCDGIYNQDAEKNKRFNQPCKDTKNAKKKIRQISSFGANPADFARV